MVDSTRGSTRDKSRAISMLLRLRTRSEVVIIVVEGVWVQRCCRRLLRCALPVFAEQVVHIESASIQVRHQKKRPREYVGYSFRRWNDMTLFVPLTTLALDVDDVAGGAGSGAYACLRHTSKQTPRLNQRLETTLNNTRSFETGVLKMEASLLGCY